MHKIREYWQLYCMLPFDDKKIEFSGWFCNIWLYSEHKAYLVIDNNEVCYDDIEEICDEIGDIKAILDEWRVLYE